MPLSRNAAANAPDGYCAMNDGEAIKVLIRP
jgi:hypothetical protein